jgi:hypothetical protein
MIDFAEVWSAATQLERKEMLRLIFQRINIEEGRIAAVQPTAAFYPLLVTAGATGFEPAIFGLTGRYANRCTTPPRTRNNNTEIAIRKTEVDSWHRKPGLLGRPGFLRHGKALFLLLRLLDDGLRNVRRDLVVTLKLHAEIAPALRHRPQVSSVALHLS